jgi:excinuclease ABC subunit C
MGSRFDSAAFLRNLSTRPGVYRMLDAEGAILYVGKARNLRKRVGSYFSRKPADARTQALVQAIAAVEVTVTATEQEALLLESNLIKQHRPRFNVVLRDDKSYPYIRVTTQHDFPRFAFHRGSRKLPGRFFGPFPNAGAVRQTLQQLQKLFRVRPCEDSFFAHRTRPCLQYQIERCSAPCVGLISADDYRRDVDNAIRFVQGRNDAVLADLIARMEQSAASLAYERAAGYRDQIAAIRRVQAGQAVNAGTRADVDVVGAVEEGGTWCVALLMIRGGAMLGSRTFFPAAPRGTTGREIVSAFVGQHYLAHEPPAEVVVADPVADAGMLGDLLTSRVGRPVSIRAGGRGMRRRWLQMAADNARQALAARMASAATLSEQLAALGEVLGLPAPPSRIECFDISHTAGGETVAACVAFGADGPLKSAYRRFNIRDVAPGDDYGALAQAIERRYARRASQSAVPDLVVIDGGRGQLQRACRVLRGLHLDALPVAAVSKGPERRPGLEQLHRLGARQPLRLPRDSPALHIVQAVRDEAHRFAITGHRGRRSRASRSSALTGIAGLGPQRRRALLQHLGGLQAIARAGPEDLARVPGVSHGLAARIYAHFHDDAPPAGGSGPKPPG